MNTQPKHDLETGDLRGSAEIVVMPNGIDVGNLPNADPATDDMRGHASSSVAHAETDNSRLFVGAAAVAALIGGLGVASYATGMWDSPRPAFAPRVAMASPVVAPPVVTPPQAVVVAPNEVVAAPVPPQATKRPAVHAVRALPEPALTPPETTVPVPPAPPMNTTLTPEQPAQIAPTDPALPELSLPDLPTSQAKPPPQ